MKFKDCFIDNKGNIWKVATLIKYSKELPIFLFNITQISLEEIIKWQIINLRDFVNHFSRINTADLSIPILLRSDGYCMNGWHRIIKALVLEMTHLPAKKFKLDPEPDFRID